MTWSISLRNSWKYTLSFKRTVKDTIFHLYLCYFTFTIYHFFFPKVWYFTLLIWVISILFFQRNLFLASTSGFFIRWTFWCKNTFRVLLKKLLGRNFLNLWESEDNMTIRCGKYGIAPLTRKLNIVKILSNK